MSRLALIAAGVAGLTTLGVAPATAATAPQAGTAAVTTTTTCGYLGYQAGLATKVCADVTGTGVEIYGQVGLAGPPSPGSPAPQPRQLITSLSANLVGGASLGTVNQNVNFTASTIQVHGIPATVPCGSTVHASFSVASFPWSPNPVTLDLPIAC
ncbi:hypothetical protein AB0D08_32440 [Kitasatospora sp. NPDC048540]|uniref:hypothetical protein n=1 Tax=unclassified Kitasatospora TaxID=2633591 RepID=UPI000539E7EA|nr:hypothetical protein [Kitasatospora sp. MBT63]